MSVALQDQYEVLRRHGLSHEHALDALEDADSGVQFRCWCGRPNPCVGGAQRLVGCPIDFLGLPHCRQRGDLA